MKFRDPWNFAGTPPPPAYTTYVIGVYGVLVSNVSFNYVLRIRVFATNDQFAINDQVQKMIFEHGSWEKPKKPL